MAAGGAIQRQVPREFGRRALRSVGIGRSAPVDPMAELAVVRGRYGRSPCRGGFGWGRGRRVASDRAGSPGPACRGRARARLAPVFPARPLRAQLRGGEPVRVRPSSPRAVAGDPAVRGLRDGRSAAASRRRLPFGCVSRPLPAMGAEPAAGIGTRALLSRPGDVGLKIGGSSQAPSADSLSAGTAAVPRPRTPSDRCPAEGAVVP